MKRKLLIIFLFFLISFFSNSFAKETDYLEYADIPDTDTINFNGQVDGKNYEVWIDTGAVYYVTGSDNKIHNCFALVGTGYTNKLGEIYFGYEGIKSYVCDDYKLRGLFKVGAGGRGHMEDLENDPEKWKCYLDKIPTDGYYYHNGDGNGNGTGQARLDDIGYANFNSAKTAFDLKSAFSNVKITSVFSNLNGKIANGSDSAEIQITATYIGSGGQTFYLKNFKFQNIYFITGVNSDILINGVTGAGFKFDGNLSTNENGVLTGKVYLFHPGTNLSYKLALKVSNEITLYSSGSSLANIIKPPYQINLILTGSETDKTFINYENKVKTQITADPHINNLSFSNTSTLINLGIYSGYFQQVITGESIIFSDSYQKIEINYIDPSINFFSEDILPFNYTYQTDYSFTFNGDNYKVINYSGQTNNGYMYKDGKVKTVWVKKDSDFVTADGITPFKYSIKLLSEKGYPINHLNFQVQLKDGEKFFNLTGNNLTYITGFFIITGTNLADTKGIYSIGVISYKPINSELQAFLTGYIKNIKYQGYYAQTSPDKYIVLTDPVFTKIASLDLEEKTITINKETTLQANYTSGSNTSNGGYSLTGYLFDCPSCGFKEGKNLSGDDFGNTTFSIFITGGNDPSKLVYSGYFWYNLDGNYGNKKVYVPFQKQYTDFLYIGGGSVQIIGNVVSDRKIVGGKSYIATIINPVQFKNKLKKKIFTTIIRGGNITVITSDYDLDLSTLTGSKIFKCSNPDLLVNVYGTYKKTLNLYFLNCQINISSNILPANNKDKLSIIEITTDSTKNTIDFSKDNGWSIPGNVFIGPNVKTIKANILTDGSILTYSDPNFSLDSSKIFIDDRGTNNSLKKQLFIRGKVFSKNTLGGGLQNSNNIYTLVGGKKVSASWYGFDGISASTIAKAYDISFWRNNFVKSDGTYDTGNLSEIIYNKYHCTGDTATDTSKICSKSIVIMDSNQISK